MTKAKNLSGSEQLTVSLPKQHYAYLTHLASLGRLGTTETGVAAQILIRELDALEQSGYPKVKSLKIVS